MSYRRILNSLTLELGTRVGAIAILSAGLAACSDKPATTATSPAAPTPQPSISAQQQAPQSVANAPAPAPSASNHVFAPWANAPQPDISVPFTSYVTIDDLIPTNPYVNGDRIWAYALSGATNKHGDDVWIADRINRMANLVSNAFERQEQVAATAESGRALIERLQRPEARYVVFRANMDRYEYDIPSQTYALPAETRFVDVNGIVRFGFDGVRIEARFAEGFDFRRLQVPTEQARKIESIRDLHGGAHFYTFLQNADASQEPGVIYATIVGMRFADGSQVSRLPVEEVTIRTLP